MDLWEDCAAYDDEQPPGTSNRASRLCNTLKRASRELVLSLDALEHEDTRFLEDHVLLQRYFDRRGSKGCFDEHIGDLQR